MYAIPFPEIDPVLIQIGPLAIRWYALGFIAGLLGAWWYILRLLKTERLWAGTPFNGKPSATADHIGDLFVWAALGVILGGRLGYVLFYGLIYETDHFLSAPWRIFAAWEGGMSFHGGAIGVVLAIVFFARARKLDMAALGDVVAAGAPIGIFLVRIANFINGELYGRSTDVDWCMVFPAGGPACRHPSQLYEATLEGLTLFMVLWWIDRRSTPPGTIFWTFITGYGISRLIVELFREPDQHLGFIFGPITMGQILSIPMVAIGLIMLVLGYQRARQKAAHA